MKYLKILGLAAVAAMAMAAFTAGTASATTLEVNGVKQTKSVALTASLEPGTSALLQLTNGSFANTCTESAVVGSSSTTQTGASVSGPISSLSFTKCTTESVKVDAAGTLSVAWIKEGPKAGEKTNGTVTSAGAEVTVPSPIGTLNCKTSAGVDIGVLTGKATGGTATMDISAVLNCGFLAPSATWTGSYVVTSPTGLGVVE